MRRVARAGEIAVDEIEPGAVGHALPQWVRAALEHAVPAHVRHLVAAAVRCLAARQVKAQHFAGNQAEPGRAVGRAALGAVRQQHLHADADAEQRLARRRLQHRLQQAGLAQLAHAVAHGPLSRQHHPVGGAHLRRVGGDDGVDARVLRRMNHRLRHRAQVAHAVVDHGHRLVYY